MRQRSGPLGSVLSRGYEAVEVVKATPRHTALQQFQAAADAGQQVVEVVCHSTSQLTERIQLLRLPKLFFG